MAETNRAPFDLPEAETELVSGCHREYSAFRFSFYFLGEYINMIVISLFASTLFLGGTDGPPESTGVSGIIWLLLKTVAFLFFYVWLRATLPRFRYDAAHGHRLEGPPPPGSGEHPDHGLHPPGRQRRSDYAHLGLDRPWPPSSPA